MAKLWYGHFDSTPEDPRKLLAEDLATHTRAFVTNGIRNGGTCLEITEYLGMAVKMDTGVCNIEDYVMDLSEDIDGRYYPIALQASNPSLPRIDRIILRLDKTIQARTIIPQALLGTASISPVPTALTRNKNIYEICLAEIWVDAGVMTIDKSKITDKRFDTELCGLMNSVLGLDPSAWQRRFDDFILAIIKDDDEFLMEQLVKFDTQLSVQQSTWEAWFATIKIDLQLYTTFDFENLASLGSTERTTVFTSDTQIDETIKIENSFIIVATRKTIFEDNGDITTTETVYKDGSMVIRQSTIVTTFNEDGSITEAVSI